MRQQRSADYVKRMTLKICLTIFVLLIAGGLGTGAGLAVAESNHISLGGQIALWTLIGGVALGASMAIIFIIWDEI